MAVIAHITGLAAGDDWPMYFTVGTPAGPIPSGVRIVRAWFKLGPTLRLLESAPILNVEITTGSPTPPGRVLDDNADNDGVGLLYFLIPSTDTDGPEIEPQGSYAYLVRVEYSDGRKITLQKGGFVPQ
jgi:hypothetical protein